MMRLIFTSHYFYSILDSEIVGVRYIWHLVFSFPEAVLRGGL